jgi:hypothetical protein
MESEDESGSIQGVYSQMEPLSRDEKVVGLEGVGNLLGDGMVQPVLIKFAILFRAQAQGVTPT